MTNDPPLRVSESDRRARPTLRFRDRQPEVMDEPGLDGRLHVEALGSLRRINRLSRTAAALWSPIRDAARTVSSAGEPLRILDIASGGGDVAIDLARRARTAGVDVQVEGVDISPRAVDYANAAAAASGFANVSFHVSNVLENELPVESHDVVTCSLFLHHLEEQDARRLLETMAATARILVVLSDLRRTRLGYLLSHLVTRTIVRSPVVRVDGPLSVAAAFSIDEVRRLAARGGMEAAIVTRHWPQRFLLTWRRR